jgi:hypothetical protein
MGLTPYGALLPQGSFINTRHNNRNTRQVAAPFSSCLQLACVLFSLILTPAAVNAQDHNKRSFPAINVETAPVVDGEVRNDPVWQAITPTGGFTQTRPDAGQPSSQITEVRVVYTENAIYFGFICFDDDPATIVVADSRRDADLDETDSLQIILDTYLDGQNGFVFGTNPSGLEYDGQLSRAGEGGALLSQMRAGAGGGFNINWDGVWEVKTTMGEFGWSAEFMIPFKTLRYPKRDVQSWGLNIQRNIRRRNENAYWAPLGQQFNLLRVSDAGLLTDVQMGSQRNLKIVPYVLGEISDIGEEGRATDGEWGFDIKYSLTPALTLDLTYNTDFAQVEVDESQVSLDRFNLFFPEKRPFFLENAGLFTVGKPSQVELFFSRRIGLSEDGDVIPIKAGARISGSVIGTNIGMMYMQTESLAGVAPANQFGVARVNKELPNRSSVGAIFVSREATGSLAVDGDKNSTYGVDGRWGIGEYGSISGYAASTSTPGLEGDDQSWSLSGSYDSSNWLFNLNYVEVGENFNPEVGFLNRDNYRYGMFRALRRYRPDNSRIGLQEIRPHMSYTSYWNFDGFQESGFLHIDNHLEWKNSAELHTGVNFTTEGLLEPFEIYDGIIIPPGTYDNSELSLGFYSNQGAWISFNFSTVIGGFYSGDRVSLRPSMRLRLGEKFNTELSYVQNDVELPEGDFITRVGRLRLAYSFTTRVTLEALFQYNNVDDFWSTNLRFSWLRAANTGLYIVYNDIKGFDRYTGDVPNRSLIVKYTHLFDLF